MIQIRGFPRPDLGPNRGAFPIQYRAKTSQNGVYHPQFLNSSDSKKAKLQLHEKLHKIMNEKMFSFTFYANIPEFFMMNN